MRLSLILLKLPLLKSLITNSSCIVSSFIDYENIIKTKASANTPCTANKLKLKTYESPLEYISISCTREALLGGRPGLTGHKVTKDLSNFYENGGKELKFECVFDNTDQKDGKKEKYQLVYSLENAFIIYKVSHACEQLFLPFLMLCP